MFSSFLVFGEGALFYSVNRMEEVTFLFMWRSDRNSISWEWSVDRGSKGSAVSPRQHCHFTIATLTSFLMASLTCFSTMQVLICVLTMATLIFFLTMAALTCFLTWHWPVFSLGTDLFSRRRRCTRWIRLCRSCSMLWALFGWRCGWHSKDLYHWAHEQTEYHNSDHHTMNRLNTTTVTVIPWRDWIP